MVGWRNVIVGALIALAGAGPAWAECSERGEPGVDWRGCFFDRQNLSAVDLTNARLRGASFKRADLTGANLSKAGAFRAKFVNAKMSKARLDGAQLEEADLSKADLTGATWIDGKRICAEGSIGKCR